MARSFTEEEVHRMVEEAVAKAVAPLKARIAELEAEVARLKKNSTTSSKPPSSDIVKPPRPQAAGGGKRRKRRGGGQPGHERHIRPLFPPEEVDKTWIYQWETVPAGWKPLRRFRVVQQVELVEKPYRVIEHRARLYRNLRTGQVLAATLPEEVRRAGLLGPRLTALVAYQKGVCHMSVETIRRFQADVLHLPISHGQVVKTVQKASEAPGPATSSCSRLCRNRSIWESTRRGIPSKVAACGVGASTRPAKAASRGFTSTRCGDRRS